MDWDPQTYLAFASERERAAGELLARIGLVAPRRIADLGCGTGNSTRLLAARWPEAAIDGIDAAADMLAEARRSAVHARWVAADIAAWQPTASYDLVFSNAALHWVPGHERLLPKLMSLLSPGGALAFQVPCNFAEPSHTIAQELAESPRWAGKLARARNWWTVLEPQSYFEILAPRAVTVDIWETRYLQRLQGADAMLRWGLGSALRPYTAGLADDERKAFLAEYRRRASLAYSERADGITLLPFKRLFCIAVRL